jgi:hypothetical protein
MAKERHIPSEGNCFICGATLGKVKMKNHVLKEHCAEASGEKAILIRAEGAYDKDYWLLFDVPLKADLEDIDDFLRAIWLECCGHMSTFEYHNAPRGGFDVFGGSGDFDDDEEFGISKSKKVSSFDIGTVLDYQYDMGDTTPLTITFLSAVTRPKQPAKESLRLLARNVPFHYTCITCGKPAKYLCTECLYETGTEGACFCKECLEKHQDKSGHEMRVPITNSPRMGQCAYDGELDKWTFDPAKVGGR